MTSTGRIDDTQPTDDGGVVEYLRSQGLLGPFRISDWAALSDRGLVRDDNEDRWRERERRLFVLADGMGGYAGGAVAANTATAEAIATCGDLTDASAPEVLEHINDAVGRVGARLGLEELGTTLLVLVAYQNHVVTLSVGDSRIYRMRNRSLEQLTEDHTVRNELLSAGVPLERARDSNIRLDALTAHIGPRNEDRSNFHVASYSVMAGDRYLLCSDGIHGQVDADDLAASFGYLTCEEAVAELVRLARASGGRDNATAVMVGFDTVETTHG